MHGKAGRWSERSHSPGWLTDRICGKPSCPTAPCPPCSEFLSCDMTAREKEEEGTKTKHRSKGRDKHDPVRPAVPRSCLSSLEEPACHGCPFPAPSCTPATNKGSDKKPAQVKTGLTPFQAQGSGFSADFTPHPSCLPPRGRGQDTEQGARLAGWTQKSRGRVRAPPAEPHTS